MAVEVRPEVEVWKAFCNSSKEKADCDADLERSTREETETDHLRIGGDSSGKISTINRSQES